MSAADGASRQQVPTVASRGSRYRTCGTVVPVRFGTGRTCDAVTTDGTGDARLTVDEGTDDVIPAAQEWTDGVPDLGVLLFVVLSLAVAAGAQGSVVVVVVLD